MEDQHRPFNIVTLITSILSVVAWIILFIGGCVAQLHGVSWWIIIYQLFFVVAVVVLLLTKRFNRFQNMVNVFLAIGTVYLTYLVQGLLNLIYNDVGARAAAAGAVILIIMEFIWIFHLTAPTDSVISGNRIADASFGNGPNVMDRVSNAINPNTNANANINTNTNTNINSNTKSESSPLPSVPQAANGNLEQVTALHSYEANPSDPQELSFNKGEQFDILDKRGNWWQVRKQDGTTGIVPSNYFQ